MFNMPHAVSEKSETLQVLSSIYNSYHAALKDFCELVIKS